MTFRVWWADDIGENEEAVYIRWASFQNKKLTRWKKLMQGVNVGLVPSIQNQIYYPNKFLKNVLNRRNTYF